MPNPKKAPAAPAPLPNRSRPKSSRAALAAPTIPLGWRMDTAWSLLGCTVAAYAAVYLLLALQLPLAPWSVCGISALLLACWLATGRPGGTRLLSLRRPGAWLALLLAGAAVLLCGQVYDTSFDGQGYHEQAIVALRYGWNPLVEPRFFESLWVWHYPKALWMIGAALYSVTGWIETGKAYNLILLLASGFITWEAARLLLSGQRGPQDTAVRPAPVRRPLQALLTGLIALAAACNPVSMAQLLTYYNDGPIASLLLLLISALILHALSGDSRALWGAAAALVLLVNIKFTAVAYAALICAFYCVYLAVRSIRASRSAQQARTLAAAVLRSGVMKPFILLLGAGLAGMLVFGFNPYVTNTLSNGHPLYPLAGPDKVDIMTSNSPGNFLGRSRFEKFLLSYTARTGDPVSPQKTEPAPLWLPQFDDFKQVNVDTRSAGFGPLLPWMGLLSGGVVLLLLAAERRLGAAAALGTAALLATVFINPEPWWARYVPQLWLVPLAAVLAAQLSRHLLLRTAGVLLLAVSLWNAGGVAQHALETRVLQSDQAAAQLQGLRSADPPVQVFLNGFTSIPIHMQELGIPYKPVHEHELCAQPTQFLYTIAYYCE